MATEIDDYEQAILDSCEDADIMAIYDLIAEGYDFYEALEHLGLI